METRESDTKGDDSPSQNILLKVVDQDSNEVYFKMKKRTPLRKMMDSYCKTKAISQSSVRFVYDGKRVQPDQSPEDLGMQDDDVIDVLLEQTGGNLGE